MATLRIYENLRVITANVNFYVFECNPQNKLKFIKKIDVTLFCTEEKEFKNSDKNEMNKINQVNFLHFFLVIQKF